jgi:hypothetical protein
VNAGVGSDVFAGCKPTSPRPRLESKVRVGGNFGTEESDFLDEAVAAAFAFSEPIDRRALSLRPGLNAPALSSVGDWVAEPPFRLLRNPLGSLFFAKPLISMAV